MKKITKKTIGVIIVIILIVTAILIYFYTPKESGLTQDCKKQGSIYLNIHKDILPDYSSKDFFYSPSLDGCIMTAVQEVGSFVPGEKFSFAIQDFSAKLLPWLPLSNAPDDLFDCNDGFQFRIKWDVGIIPNFRGLFYHFYLDIHS
jgi:hypothetical protein